MQLSEPKQSYPEFEIPWLSWPETKHIVELLAGAHIASKPFNMRFFGGCIRDTYLGIAPNDFDIKILEPFDEIETRLRSSELIKSENIEKQRNFGIFRINLNGRCFDLVSLKNWLEANESLSINAMTTDEMWEVAYKNCDFTFNALFMNAQGKVFDYSTCIDDLKNQTLRFVGDPYESLEKYPRRILRYFRMHSMYAKNPIDHKLCEWLSSQNELFEKINPVAFNNNMHSLMQSKNALSVLKHIDHYKTFPHFFGFEIYSFDVLVNLLALEELLGLKPNPMLRLLAVVAQANIPPESALQLLQKKWDIPTQGYEAMGAILEIGSKMELPLDVDEEDMLANFLGENMFLAIMFNWALEDDPVSKSGLFIPTLSKYGYSKS